MTTQPFTAECTDCERLTVILHDYGDGHVICQSCYERTLESYREAVADYERIIAEDAA